MAAFGSFQPDVNLPPEKTIKTMWRKLIGLLIRFCLTVSMGISGSQNGGTVPHETIFW